MTMSKLCLKPVLLVSLEKPHNDRTSKRVRGRRQRARGREGEWQTQTKGIGSPPWSFVCHGQKARINSAISLERLLSIFKDMDTEYWLAGWWKGVASGGAPSPTGSGPRDNRFMGSTLGTSNWGAAPERESEKDAKILQSFWDHLLNMIVADLYFTFFGEGLQNLLVQS